MAKKAVDSQGSHMSQQIDTNFNGHISRVPAITAGMEVFRSSHLTRVDSGLSCDTFNIIHITDGQGITENELVQAVQHFKSKASAYCIWINETNLTEEAKQLFARHGITQQNFEPGMVLDLTSYELKENAVHQHARFASTAKEMADFARVIAENWTPPDQHVISYYAQTAQGYLQNDQGIHIALYYADGQPVSVIEMFPTDGETVGLYALATLAAARGKGIGTALLTFVLNQAKALGYKTAVLQASDDGFGIYGRLGFKVVTNYYEFA